MKRLMKHKELLLIVLPLALLLCSTNFAHAGLFDFSITTLGKGVATILYLLGQAGAYLVTFGGTLVNWAFNLNSFLITNPTVQTGWVVTRDIANLGFVLAIIIMAFGTILGLESYNAKKLLFNLIVAAVLINFSLVFAGIILDFSGMLTNFFLSKATAGDPSVLGEKLANGLQIQKMLSIKDTASINANISNISQDFNSMAIFISSLLFVVIFTVICAFTLIGLAVMFLIRYIYLTILLILMPLAWLFYIWPDTQGLYSKWWNEFLRWAWFAPSATFFIYLALSIATTQKAAFALSSANNLLNPGGSLLLIMENVSGTIGQMIAVLAILWGGLITAEKMGGYGSSISRSLVMGAKNAIVGGTVGATVGAMRMGSSMTGRMYEGIRGKTFDQDLRKMTSTLSATPIIGGLAAQANRALVMGTSERTEQYKKNFDGMDRDARLNYLKRDPLLMREEERAALMSSIAGKNEMTGAKEKLGYDPNLDANNKVIGWRNNPSGKAKYDSYAESAVKQEGSTAKAMISKDPTTARFKVKIEGKSLAQIAKEQKDKIVEAFKTMSSDAIDDLDLDIFSQNPEYLAELRGMHLSRILDRGAAEQQDFIRYIDQHLKAAGSLSTPPPYLNKLNGLKTIINNSPSWVFKVP